MTEPLVVVGLLSGGKDSCYNLCHCVKQGHKVAALATLAPPEGKDELDSYMYQTVGHDAVHLIAKAMDLPLYRGVIRGQAINQTSSYGDRTPSSSRQTLLDDADETEDLYKLLCEVKAAQPGINAVSVGAILSNYQRVRVEHVALRAGLHLLPLCYLWQRDQGELLDEMCQIGMMESILIKVAGAGLKEEDLGKSLVRMRTKLHKLHNIYGAHICGEGGEYETFTLDCPLFKKRIVIDQTTTVTHSDSSFASVYYLRIDRAHLEEKTDAGDTLTARVENVKVADLLDPLGRRTLQACTAAAGAVSISEAENTLQARTSHRANRRRKRASVAKQGHWYAFGDITGARSSNIAEEFGSAFDLLIDELREHNLSAAHLAHLSVYLSSQAHFGVLNKVYQMYFGVDPPSRACVAVNMQGGQDKTNLIIDAVAFDDGSLYNVEGAGDDLAAAAAAASSSSSSKSSPPSLRSRKVLHVQSRSYWAAANIGPYSQSVNAGGRITIAGQIGLAPTTLRLVDSPMLQIALALQHARRVFKAILEGRTEKQRGWVEGCICWIDDAQWLKPAAAAWKVQEVVADEDDDDDKDDDNDDVQPGWESEWLGKTFKASDLPLCFIVLPMGGLPRSATIEWQLFAHDGKAVVSELQDDKEDDENQDGEAAVPAILSGEDVTFAGFSGSYQAISSKQGASTFGIASLRRSLGTTAPSSSHLLLLLSNALSVKILHHQEKGIDLSESTWDEEALTQSLC